MAGVFLYGSQVERTATARSDVDICIVAGPGLTPGEALDLAWTRARLGGAKYDLHVFEELPLYLQAAVLERGVLLVARDPPGLYEYLRRWRKMWADQAHRNRPTDEVVRRVMAARAEAREDARA